MIYKLDFTIFYLICIFVKKYYLILFYFSELASLLRMTNLEYTPVILEPFVRESIKTPLALDCILELALEDDVLFH